MAANHVDRRTILRSAGAVLAGALLAGCTSDSSNDDGGSNSDGDGHSHGHTVQAGPDNKLVFDPDEITIETGETVTWEFQSASHNVSCVPEHHDKVKLPDGAEPFGSMGKDGDKLATVPKGDTYEHTFETPGTYQYVCVPHASSGMIGTVIVEE